MDKLLKAIAVLALAGCVTPDQINAGARSFEGKSYKEAFAALGFPDQEQKIADHTVYIWSNRNAGSYTVPTTETATTYVGGQTVYTTVQGTKTESYDWNCTLRLVVDPKGIVIEAKADGNIGGCQRYADYAPKKSK